MFGYLPINYGRAVLDKIEAENLSGKFPGMTLERLQNVVRKRGTEPDWVAYEALQSVKRPSPVARNPRKKHKPRRQQLQAA